MFKFILEDSLGEFVVIEYEERSYHYAVKFKLSADIFLYGNRFDNVEWVMIPKSIVKEIIKE